MLCAVMVGSPLLPCKIETCTEMLCTLLYSTFVHFHCMSCDTFNYCIPLFLEKRQELSHHVFHDILYLLTSSCISGKSHVRSTVVELSKYVDEDNQSVINMSEFQVTSRAAEYD